MQTDLSYSELEVLKSHTRLLRTNVSASLASRKCVVYVMLAISVMRGTYLKGYLCLTESVCMTVVHYDVFKKLAREGLYCTSTL